MTTKTTISLLDFANGFPEGECTIGFYTSVGVPTGQEILLNDPDYATPFDEDSADLMGSVDKDGIWRWDGEGNPADFNRNTVLRIDAWYDHAARAAELMEAD